MEALENRPRNNSTMHYQILLKFVHSLFSYYFRQDYVYLAFVCMFETPRKSYWSVFRENLTRDVYVDKEIFIKFWKLFG